MLTLKEINDISFRKARFSGYKGEDVDDFVDAVSESYKELKKENTDLKAKLEKISQKNGEMIDKLKILSSKVEAYRSDEEEIKTALIASHKLASIAVNEANEKAELIINQANIKAEEIIEEAKNNSIGLVDQYKEQVEEEKRILDIVKGEVAVFKRSLFEAYKSHLITIGTLEDFEEEIKDLDIKARFDAVLKPESQQVAFQEEIVFEQEQLEEISEENVQVNIDENIDEGMQLNEQVSEQQDEQEKEEIIKTDEQKMFEEYSQKAQNDEDAEFDTIDFNAYNDLPEVYKENNKEELFNTLEFGSGINVKKK